MNIKLSGNIENYSNFIFFVYKGQDLYDLVLAHLNIELKNNYDFEGKHKETLFIMEYNITIILIGLGNPTKIDYEKIRQSSSIGYDIVCKKKIRNIMLFPSCNIEFIIRQLEGFYLTSYKFEKYKSKKDNYKVNLTLFIKNINKNNYNRISNTLNVIQSVKLVRDLGNEPANKLNPDSFCNIIDNIGKESGFSVDILNTDIIRKLKMNLLDSVSLGSKYGSKLVIIRNNVNLKEKPIIFIGKGVTFDSGGISIKPSRNMYEMKGDMLGAGTVLGIITAATKNKINKNIIGIIPIAENMPGRNATRPGDIITSMSGKTVEIRNTDAEGRLMLADAITFSYRFNPGMIIDLATLTGSQAHLSCEIFSNVLGNCKYLIKKIIKSGNRTNEKVVELPLFPEFKEMTKSNVADIKNAEFGCRSGCILAASFLSNFIKNVRWLHLDIAGPTTFKTKKFYIPSGTTGYGVRLFIDFLNTI